MLIEMTQNEYDEILRGLLKTAAAAPGLQRVAWEAHDKGLPTPAGVSTAVAVAETNLRTLGLKIRKAEAAKQNRSDRLRARWAAFERS